MRRGCTHPLLLRLTAERLAWQEDTFIDVHDMAETLRVFKGQDSKLSISDESYSAPLIPVGKLAEEEASDALLKKLKHAAPSPANLPTGSVSNQGSTTEEGTGPTSSIGEGAPTAAENTLTLRERLALAKSKKEVAAQSEEMFKQTETKPKARPAPAVPRIRADKYCQLANFTSEEFARVMLGLLSEVADMHKRGHCHGDIKSANVSSVCLGVSCDVVVEM
jgi:hypothetical protein